MVYTQFLQLAKFSLNRNETNLVYRLNHLSVCLYQYVEGEELKSTNAHETFSKEDKN